MPDSVAIFYVKNYNAALLGLQGIIYQGFLVAMTCAKKKVCPIYFLVAKISHAKLIAMSIKIGVMGDRGSFSEMAGEQYIKNGSLSEAEILPLVTAETVLNNLEKGLCDKGIFPIENSNGGIVIEAVHAMAKHRFSIEKMFELDVHHNLLVKKGITASHIKSISSHDQALKQCRIYLKRVWPNADIVPFKDTAAAANALRSGELPDTTAVIASRRAAELYDLDVLEESIQDLKYNYTTFVVATKFAELGKS